MNDETTDLFDWIVPIADSNEAMGPSEVELCGVNVHSVDRRAALRSIARLVDAWAPSYVVTPNVDHMILVRDDPEMRDAYAGSALRLADGGPLVTLSRALGEALPARVTGSDLMVDVIDTAAFRRWRLFILGGAPDVLERALDTVRRGHPHVDISGWSPPIGFEGTPDDDIAVNMIRAAKPDIVFVCLGSPRGEVWVHQRIGRFDHGVFLCVGAAVDFLAGSVPRAPRWMRENNLEWLYRLGREPRRMWRRYLVRDAQFLPMAVRAVISERRAT